MVATPPADEKRRLLLRRPDALPLRLRALLLEDGPWGATTEPAVTKGAESAPSDRLGKDCLQIEDRSVECLQTPHANAAAIDRGRLDTVQADGTGPRWRAGAGDSFQETVSYAMPNCISP